MPVEPSSEAPLLLVQGLTKLFTTRRRQGVRSIAETVRAVDNIDLAIWPSETLGLVGESGCGKSTAARAILRLIRPTSGTVQFMGSDLGALPREALRRIRRHTGIVFQDPQAAIDPRMMVGEVVAEPLRAHGPAFGRRQRLAAAKELLHSVGLGPDTVSRYPHEFSGGQRQRIGIARAIATDPKLLILDEPTSALDISIRAQIVNLLEDLQRERQLAYLFIAHDLSLVRHICDRVAVMYLGRIVETGPTERVYSQPLHPYTQALLASVPVADPTRRRLREPLVGETPDSTAIPSGCRFRTRCPLAQDLCAQVSPELRDMGRGHMAACHFAPEDTGADTRELAAISILKGDKQ